jgi:predicted DCC family thiol-disulfide oxidoreductase YuxK
VQRNRFDWFGKRPICFLPDAAQKQRFLTTEPEIN